MEGFSRWVVSLVGFDYVGRVLKIYGFVVCLLGVFWRGESMMWECFC